MEKTEQMKPVESAQSLLRDCVTGLDKVAFRLEETFASILSQQPPVEESDGPLPAAPSSLADRIKDQATRLAKVTERLHSICARCEL